MKCTKKEQVILDVCNRVDIVIDKKVVEKVVDKEFDKLKSKISKMSDITDDLYSVVALTPEEEWNKYCKERGVCANWNVYPHSEKRDIVAIYNSHYHHSAIQIPNDLKAIVDYIKIDSRTDKDIAQRICAWVLTYIDYDNVHAAASRLYKAMT